MKPTLQSPPVVPGLARRAAALAAAGPVVVEEESSPEEKVAPERLEAGLGTEFCHLSAIHSGFGMELRHLAGL